MTRPSVTAIAMFRKNSRKVRTASGPSVDSRSSWATPIASEAKTSGMTTKNSIRRKTCPIGSSTSVANPRAASRKPGEASPIRSVAPPAAAPIEQPDQDAIGEPGAGFCRHDRRSPAPAGARNGNLGGRHAARSLDRGDDPRGLHGGRAGCRTALPGACDHRLERVPVILIPGLLGSRLARAADGVELWPGSTRKLLTSDYADLALRIDPVTLEPLDDGLVPSGIFEGAAGKDFYRRLVRELREAGGYQVMSPGRPVVEQQARLYVFTYDWRQDLVKTVGKLDELIEQIRRDYRDPHLRVDVVAHSMGGVIVRYFERYGTVDVLDGNSFPVTGLGRSKLRRVVLLGTPNQGTVTAVHKFLNGYRVGISALPTEGVATMPSTFQLFPHPLVDWVVNINGKPLDFDIFDVELWRRYEWSIFDHRIQRRMDGHRDVWPQQDVFERWFEKRLDARSPLHLVADGAGRRRAADRSRCCSAATACRRRGGSCSRTSPAIRSRGCARSRSCVPSPGVDYETLMFAPGDGSVTLSSLLSRQDMSREVPQYEQEGSNRTRTDRLRTARRADQRRRPARRADRVPAGAGASAGARRRPRRKRSSRSLESGRGRRRLADHGDGAPEGLEYPGIVAVVGHERGPEAELVAELPRLRVAVRVHEPAAVADLETLLPDQELVDVHLAAVGRIQGAVVGISPREVAL